MKLFQRCLLVLLLCSGVLAAQAATLPPPGASKLEKFYKKFPGLANVSIDNFIKLSPKEYEKQSGKELNFKEKMVYKVVKWKLHKNLKKAGATEKQKTLGLIAMALGIVAVLFLFVPSSVGLLSILFAAGGFVLGIKSLKGNSNAPGLIGLILSSAVVVTIILAVIVIASAFDDW